MRFLAAEAPIGGAHIFLVFRINLLIPRFHSLSFVSTTERRLTSYEPATACSTILYYHSLGDTPILALRAAVSLRSASALLDLLAHTFIHLMRNCGDPVRRAWFLTYQSCLIWPNMPLLLFLVSLTLTSSFFLQV